ncbi:MAG TPA: ATP-binding cassette domain-containing protein [Acidimicrobiia bacterium]|nr:ATP-binding cassette domain-containing protein [Acidimicrobiia bacterium]
MARRDSGDDRVRLYEAGRSGIKRSVLVLGARALSLAGAAVVVGQLIDTVLTGESVAVPLIALGALLATAAALGWVGPLLADDTASKVETATRARIVGSVIDRPAMGYRAGEVTNRATEGAAAVGSLAGAFLPQLIGGIVIPLLICVVVAFIDLPAALILLVTVPAVPLLLRLMEKRFASVTARYWATADQLTARFFDGIQGMKTLKVLDASREYGGRLAEESERLRGETMRLLRVNQLALLAVDSLFTLGTVVAAAGAAMWRLQAEAISVGEAVALVLLGVALIEPLSQIGRFFYVGAIGRAAAKDIEAFLSEPGVPFVARTGDEGTVQIDDVSFAYGDGRVALEGVSLSVQPGQVIGLVGPSGAGKSTLAALISGLLQPDSGTVSVGGRVAVVSQQPFLFHGSLRDNLLLARPDADDDALWSVLDAADLSGVVSDRDRGLDLALGERGLRLSGGEAQRLTIARMLLTDAPIVVLDEPTSNVDIETEARIRAALDRLTTAKTVIVIAHRRSTLIGVDRIVAMDDGRIVAEAGPAEPRGAAILDSLAVPV